MSRIGEMMMTAGWAGVGVLALITAERLLLLRWQARRPVLGWCLAVVVASGRIGPSYDGGTSGACGYRILMANLEEAVSILGVAAVAAAVEVLAFEIVTRLRAKRQKQP